MLRRGDLNLKDRKKLAAALAALFLLNILLILCFGLCFGAPIG